MATKKTKKEDKNIVPNNEVATLAKKALKSTIDNYKKAAAHQLEASNFMLEAVRHYEAGNLEKAAHNALLAHGHHAIAGSFLTDEAKHHAQAQKRSNFRK
jgi:hypothetical protein